MGAYQPEWWPIFFHKGVIVGLRNDFYWEHFVFDPDAEEFFVDGEVTKDGRKCISLKTRHEFGGNPIQSNHYEYILDQERITRSLS